MWTFNFNQNIFNIISATYIRFNKSNLKLNWPVFKFNLNTFHLVNARPENNKLKIFSVLNIQNTIISVPNIRSITLNYDLNFDSETLTPLIGGVVL